VRRRRKTRLIPAKSPIEIPRRKGREIPGSGNGGVRAGLTRMHASPSDFLISTFNYTLSLNAAGISHDFGR